MAKKRKKRRLSAKGKRVVRYFVLTCGALVLLFVAIPRLSKLKRGHEVVRRVETPARTFRYTKTYLTSYSRFNDLNDVQMLAAQAVGVPPVKDGAEADAMKDRLKELVSCEYYLLDNLTHSSPYLTKGAASLLESIGSSFRDSLDSKGLPPYRIIVTSVLRTGEDVRRLRKINSNASSNSTHCLAATFDISWSRYDRLGRDQVPPEDLKRVLGEVLHDLRGRGDCYVKHEAKQACFHVTCRKK